MDRKERISKVNKCVELIKKGNNHQAVYELHDLMGGTLRYIAKKYLRNREDVEDMVQIFWSRIFEIAKVYPSGTNAFSYLCKTMQNRTFNYIRDNLKYTTCSSLEDVVLKVDKEEIEEIMTEKANAKYLVDKAIAKLPEREQQIIKESYYLEKPVREIAEDMGISKTVIAELRLQATEKLKQELKSLIEDSGQK